MALSAPQIMVRAASAQIATASEVANPGFHNFKLGDFCVTTILDGGRPSEGPHPIFGEDQEATAVAELMEANFLPPDQFVNGLPLHCQRREQRSGLHLAALPAHDGVHRRLVNERADERALLERIADGQLAVGGDEGLHELRLDGFVDDDAARAGAALAGGADGAEEDGAQRELQVGRRRHDDRIIAAQLEERAAEAPGHDLADAPAHAGRARGRHQRNPAVRLRGADGFDRALADFAEVYADQNDRDYEAMAGAVADGRTASRMGITGERLRSVPREVGT